MFFALLAIAVTISVSAVPASLASDASDWGAGSAASVSCIGDGASGPRVQAIYAVASDRPDRFDKIAPLIHKWAADIDSVFNASAQETGGERHVRFVTDAGCQVAVDSVILTPTGDDDLSGTIAELRSQGYVRSDRKYLVWTDANVYCGISELIPDDNPSANNANNGVAGVGGMISRIDTRCWGQLQNTISVEAHELMHILGGVQSSAPHATVDGHCFDEYDAMCHANELDTPLADACPPSHERLFDCNHDDYFSTRPPPGSYLANHWNAANSRFLTGKCVSERCAVSISVRSPDRLRLILKRGVSVKFTARTSCSLSSQLVISRDLAERMGLLSRDTETVVLGRRSARLSAGHSSNLTVKLTSKAKRRLRRARDLVVTLRTAVTSVSGGTEIHTKRIALLR